jgi:hypothetical protein
LVVGDRCFGFFDQHRAGSFNGDAGQHAAGFITHLPGDLTLR